MRVIVGVFCVTLLTGCGFKYQSFVEGKTPAADIVRMAVNDLVSTFDRSDATSDIVQLHPAENDRLMRSLLESRLRESGYSIVNRDPALMITPSTVGESSDAQSVSIRYRASYDEQGVGTFCLGLGDDKKSICRMYAKDGSPLSNITHTGISLKERPYTPTNLKLETLSEQLARLTTEVLMAAKPKAQQSDIDVSSIDTTSTTASRNTEGEVYYSVPTEEIKNNIDRFLLSLPEGTSLSMISDRLNNESDARYRARLFRHMEEANSYIKTGVLPCRSVDAKSTACWGDG